MALQIRALSFASAISMGFRSGLQKGMNRNQAPTAFMVVDALGLLCDAGLFRMVFAPSAEGRLGLDIEREDSETWHRRSPRAHPASRDTGPR